jgi:hypothetical protein
MKTCKCGKQVAPNDRLCPGGSKRFPHPVVQVSVWMFAVLLVLGLVMAVSHPKPMAPVTTVPQKRNVDAGLDRVVTGAMSLRKATWTPDSFVLEEVLGMPNGAYCYWYRAQNGFFGRINREHAVLPLKASNPDRSDTAWRRYCANKTGADLTENVTAMMRLLQ